jgi:hypothetical protein
MPDEIVVVSVGWKMVWEGKQLGQLLIATTPYDLPKIQAHMTDHAAEQLGVPPEHRDADWAARFKWMVYPMTQEQVDEYLDMPNWED